MSAEHELSEVYRKIHGTIGHWRTVAQSYRDFAETLDACNPLCERRIREARVLENCAYALEASFESDPGAIVNYEWCAAPEDLTK